MNIPDISEILETFFGLKKIKFFDVDQDRGSGIFFTLDPGSWMEKFGSGIRIRNTALFTKKFHSESK
jgi:hypothetical protein